MQQTDVLLTGLMFAGGLASLATWLVLLVRCWRGPVLEYQPRRPVPWGLGGTLLAVFLVGMATASFLSDETAPPLEMLHTYQYVQRIALGILQQSLLVGVFFTVVVVVSRATQRDLGLPDFADDLGRDVRTGAMAWLAALLPVFTAQAVLVKLLGQQSQHPLINMVLDEPQPIIMALSFVAAVVVAPICEEITFRLLLQGWLEKWEDRLVGAQAVDDDAEELESEEGETRGQGDKEMEAIDSSPSPPFSLSPCLESPVRGMAGLPHGWLPILISSLLFALAHLGQGTAPISLFLLAIILGYIYQRTHHIVPCIVAHMLFNLLTLLVLGLIVYTRTG